jgi:hypothetical protein
MSIAEFRGGIPAVYRGTSLGTTPLYIPLAKHLERMNPEAQTGRYSWGTCKWMRIQNHDTSDAMRVYFFESHATAGEHYILIPAKATGDVTWWEGPVEAKEIWVAADTNTVSAFDVTAFMRRG